MTRVASEWVEANQANWDERVDNHLRSEFYDLAALRRGRGRLNSIEEDELGRVSGLSVLHLQCHFGQDSLTLAQRGASVVGLDFSAPAIAAAQSLAEELNLKDRVRFVEANVYDAQRAINAPGAFDRVYVTWGAINWLPDINRWAEIVAHFLKPGGALYLAEGHPSAFVFDDLKAQPDGMPGWCVPYFHSKPLVFDFDTDYADETATLKNTRTYEWIHPIGSIVTALIESGMTIRWLREHDAVPWRMFKYLEEDQDGMYRWPDQKWFPLAFSLWAERNGS